VRQRPLAAANRGGTGKGGRKGRKMGRERGGSRKNGRERRSMKGRFASTN